MKNINPTISDLQAIPCKENGEPLVQPKVLCEYRRLGSGVSSILVRKSVADKLQRVQKRLYVYDPSMKLLVVEGYRSPIYQERYFLKELLQRYNPGVNFELLLEQVHKLVALPSIAGHPTGGAIDLTIAHCDMGGEIADFSIPERLPTYSPFTTPKQAEMRILLHDLMVSEGFAPFYGEWWHFSYGDREWAAFYGAPKTIYSTINPSCLEISLMKYS